MDNEAARENVVRFLRFAGAESPSVVVAGPVATISSPVTGAMIEKAGGKAPAPAMQRGGERGPARAADRRRPSFSPPTRSAAGTRRSASCLVRGFLYTLSEMEAPPKTLVFMNSGVRLAAERGDTIELLRTIEARGVELLVCGTCLDYLHLKEGLRAGRVSNLLEITERFLAPEGVVTVA